MSKGSEKYRQEQRAYGEEGFGDEEGYEWFVEDSRSKKSGSFGNGGRGSEGCYIATAVYGSYDAPEVMVLRRFRDERLKRSAAGRWFIRTYYKLSPPVANKLKDAHYINRMVKIILDSFIRHLVRYG